MFTCLFDPPNNFVDDRDKPPASGENSYNLSHSRRKGVGFDAQSVELVDISVRILLFV
jgi:hypothetical protein